MKVVNLTPHCINVVAGATLDESIRKYRGGEVVATIPSSGMVSAISNDSPADPIVVDGVSIQSTRKEWTKVDALPEMEEATMFIVSALYVSACRELGIPTTNLLTVGNMVVAEDGRTIIGCTGLIRND